MYEKIDSIIKLARREEIPQTRKIELQVLVDYIKLKRQQFEPVHLNFICTHNSRRSQLAQIWSVVAAHYFDVRIESFSGGVEVTECNPRTIASLKRMGFTVEDVEGNNAHYPISFTDDRIPEFLFSKLYDDPVNPKEGFAAIMTCSHADENCPVVNGCDQRISLRYDDPKLYDGTPLESVMYDYRSYQIASEMMYVFSNVK